MKKKKIKKIKKNSFLVKRHFSFDLEKVYEKEEELQIKEKGIESLGDILLQRMRAEMYAEWFYPMRLDINYRLKQFKRRKEEYCKWYEKYKEKIFLYQLTL